ncbi:MAG: hypothetical protein Q8S26_09015 [Azonexus sp.]|nr:hypothetical protein [Azonexus sp.]
MSASKSPLLSVLLAAIVLAVVILSSPAFAAEKKADPGKAEVRRLQQAQRQLTLEKDQLEDQKAAVEAELGEVKKKADGEARRASSLNRELGALRSARDAATARLAETEAELRKTQEAQRAAEAESKRLQNALALEKQQHVSCVESGKALRQVSGEVLELYESKSCFTTTLQREPLTGLKRVEVENAIEDLREKLDSQRTGS